MLAFRCNGKRVEWELPLAFLDFTCRPDAPQADDKGMTGDKFSAKATFTGEAIFHEDGMEVGPVVIHIDTFGCVYATWTEEPSADSRCWKIEDVVSTSEEMRHTLAAGQELEFNNEIDDSEFRVGLARALSLQLSVPESTNPAQCANTRATKGLL